LCSIGDVARRQRIRDNDAEFVSAGNMLREFRQDNLALVQALLGAKRIVDDAGDNATSGVLDAGPISPRSAPGSCSRRATEDR